MIFYKKYNFAFHHVNRTGGMSVKTTLKNLVGSPDEGSHYISNAHRPLADRLTEVRHLHPELGIDSMPIYVNVRNPFYRLVSIYSFRKTKRNAYKDKDFRWFFYKVYLRSNDISDGPIKPHIIDENGMIPYNVKVTKFENLNAIWPTIIFWHFGESISVMPVVNASYHGVPMNYFDNEMIDIVMERENFVIERFYRDLLL